jgi:AraC family transcriptional regulator of adaptative response/methylated-DNA-[protein]-cysteine methyltransferase
MRDHDPLLPRDVGMACAENPVAILIPCHRVIRSDGSIGGYRWGVRRKLALLRREKRAA